MLKSLHKNDTQTLPYIATKNWRLSNVANEDLILMEHGGFDGLPVALEYLDYTPSGPLITFAGCNIAKEQQSLDRVTPRSGLKTTGIFYPELDPVNSDGTFQRVIYSQIVTTFYNKYRDPTKIWGLEEIDFERSQTKRFVADKFKLFIVPRTTFGEKVLENTVVLYDTTTDNNYTITDDGHCNLFAGTNLFSRQQEVSHHPNEYQLGFDHLCDVYNSNTGSPSGIIILTASLWATPDLTASLYNISSSLVTWSYQLTNNYAFLLQRSTDSGSTWPVSYLIPSSSLQYVDANLSISGTYWYQVAATSLYGMGLFSNTASVYIPAQLGTPYDLQITSGSAILTWNEDDPNHNYYVIERSIDLTQTGSGFGFYDTSSFESYTDIFVTSSYSDGTTYWYQVAAINNDETSSFSNISSITFITPFDSPAVSDPLDQTVNVGDTATFSVTASGDNAGISPLNFQWISGSTPLVDSDRITGSQLLGDLTLSSSLIINNCQLSDTGSYYVNVATFINYVNSNTASLNII